MNNVLEKKKEEIMKAILTEIKNKSGKSGGWPACFEYSVDSDDNSALCIKMINGFNKEVFIKFDAWGLAFLAHVSNKTNIMFNKLIFKVDSSHVKRNNIYLESLIRRLSYLNINNDINIKLLIEDEIKLYSEKLYTRPDDEVVRKDYNKRSAKSNSAGLEKNLQDFLFGTNSDNQPDNTNERLAIFGFDFYRLKKANLPIVREFPTGIFRKSKKDKNRILPTELIDFVTLNKYQELSIIELKINDSNLEVISQILNYSLFFRCYLKEILKSYPTLKPKPNKKTIKCYVVNNHFHPRFKDIFKYYKNNNEEYPFEIIKVELGHYTKCN